MNKNSAFLNYDYFDMNSYFHFTWFLYVFNTFFIELSKISSLLIDWYFGISCFRYILTNKKNQISNICFIYISWKTRLPKIRFLQHILNFCDSKIKFIRSCCKMQTSYIRLILVNCILQLTNTCHYVRKYFCSCSI